VNGTNKSQNERLGVTRYNGGLFNPQHHPYIEHWWVGEKTLANVLRQLIFAQPPSRGRTRQQVIRTEETVDYSTLEVRQLGDIYEGLLGGRLQVGEGGRLELVNERGLNQRQGTFYTPDWVVVYLIRETLEPLLDQIESGSEVQAALNARSTDKRRDNSFALSVLRLNLVDPAMGSGHFLVRATEFLAQKIVGHTTTRTMTEPPEKAAVLGSRFWPVGESLSRQAYHRNKQKRPIGDAAWSKHASTEWTAIRSLSS
jgi:hypothetical protein